MTAGLGRFASPAVLILTSLADGDKHGYALMQDIRELAGVSLGPGTLYAAIARLESRGLVEPLATTDRRRPYRLTPAGADALREYLAHAHAVSSRGLTRLARFA